MENLQLPTTEPLPTEDPSAESAQTEPLSNPPAPRRDSAAVSCALRLAAALLLCALTLACKLWYPSTAKELRPWIVGSDGNRVSQAFAGLTSSVEKGMPVGKAIEVFYAEMTEDGTAP